VFPKSSILEPLLFTLYNTPLSSLIHSHKLDHHWYAYDTQVYISLSTAEIDLSLTHVDDCQSDISGWMTNYRFRLNSNKTDLVIIGTTRQHTTNLLVSSLYPYLIITSHTVRILGVTFDGDLISLTCPCCFYHIPDFRYIRRYCSRQILCCSPHY